MQWCKSLWYSSHLGHHCQNSPRCAEMILNCERGLLSPVNVLASAFSGASRRARTPLKIRSELITELHINPLRWDCTWKGRMTGENSISSLWGIVKTASKAAMTRDCAKTLVHAGKGTLHYLTQCNPPHLHLETKRNYLSSTIQDCCKQGPKPRKVSLLISLISSASIITASHPSRSLSSWRQIISILILYRNRFLSFLTEEINLKAWPFLPPWKLVEEIRLPQTVSLIWFKRTVPHDFKIIFLFLGWQDFQVLSVKHASLIQKHINSEKGIFLTLEAVDQICNTLAGTKLRLMFLIIINHHAEKQKYIKFTKQYEKFRFVSKN